jgi:hypothetical protein
MSLGRPTDAHAAEGAAATARSATLERYATYETARQLHYSYCLVITSDILCTIIKASAHHHGASERLDVGCVAEEGSIRCQR